jgi:hypothetical protein
MRAAVAASAEQVSNIGRLPKEVDWTHETAGYPGVDSRRA